MSTIQASKLNRFQSMNIVVRVAYQGAVLGIIELNAGALCDAETQESTVDLEQALGLHLFGAFVMTFGALLEPGWAFYAQERGSDALVQLDVGRVHQAWSAEMERHPAPPAPNPAQMFDADDLPF